jgi:hypothetical protein
MKTVKLYLHVDDELHTCRIRPFPRRAAPKLNTPILTNGQAWLFRRLMRDPKAGRSPYELPEMVGKWIHDLQPWLEISLEAAPGIKKYTVTWTSPYSLRVITKLKNAKEKEAAD